VEIYYNGQSEDINKGGKKKKKIGSGRYRTKGRKEERGSLEG